jgi:hypothetical protein
VRHNCSKASDACASALWPAASTTLQCVVAKVVAVEFIWVAPGPDANLQPAPWQAGVKLVFETKIVGRLSGPRLGRNGSRPRKGPIQSLELNAVLAELALFVE